MKTSFVVIANYDSPTSGAHPNVLWSTGHIAITPTRERVAIVDLFYSYGKLPTHCNIHPKHHPKQR